MHVFEPLVFLGTPEEAVPPLRALHHAGYEIALVVTRADARRGRGGKPTPSPVKRAALELGLPVSHRLEDVRTSGARRGVVVAFGLIIPPDLLAIVPMVNMHFSKLPRWRGAAPVERAILAHDDETAVGIMEMEAGLDTGPVYRQRSVPILPEDTAESLRTRLADIGTEVLLEVFAGALSMTPTPQTGEVVYAQKITSEDRRIRWDQPAPSIDAQVRIGRAHTVFRGDRFIIWRTRSSEAQAEPGALFELDGVPMVGTGSHALELSEVQPASRPRMDATAWWNGARPDGEVLGS
ncbi:MAG: methionyl-tRNA formyltransferase [Acidimicrobiia bacterium]|nr:methionyl-tRNA formyltransferase [Acidimicrobiia bacterium]